MRGKTTCVSGSPNRALNSITFGPASVEINWDEKAMIGVVVAANGYPEEYEKGAILQGLDEVSKELFVFHAGTKKGTSGEFETNGGRVLLAGAKADSLQQAQQAVYKGLEKLQCDGVFYRKDIGHMAIAHVNQ